MGCGFGNCDWGRYQGWGVYRLGGLHHWGLRRGLVGDTRGWGRVRCVVGCCGAVPWGGLGVG